jgi:hypothetical protein
LIGIVLIVGAIALFFLDRFKPGYARDSDKVYSVLCLISGVFLLGHLTMELIPSFQQMIMAGMVIALLIDNIRSRGPNPRFAQEEGPDLRPDYRPPSGGSGRPAYRGGKASVRAELENEPSRYGPAGRLLGSRDRAPMGRGGYGDDPYGDRYYDDRDRGMDRRPEGAGYGSNRTNDERIRRSRRPPLQLRGDIGTSAGNSYGGGEYGSGEYGSGGDYGSGSGYGGGEYGGGEYGGGYGSNGYSSHSDGYDSDYSNSNYGGSYGSGGYSSHSGSAGYSDAAPSAPAEEAYGTSSTYGSSDGYGAPTGGGEFPTTGGAVGRPGDRGSATNGSGSYPREDDYADYDRY